MLSRLSRPRTIPAGRSLWGAVPLSPSGGTKPTQPYCLPLSGKRSHRLGGHDPDNAPVVRLHRLHEPGKQLLQLVARHRVHQLRERPDLAPVLVEQDARCPPRRPGISRSLVVLHADAYAPIRESTDVETLKGSATALSAAQSLEERAHNLQTWPIDEGTLRFVAIVITGVVTGLIVRGSFAALGY